MPTEAHLWIDYITRTVVVCSVLHSFLPPWEVLEDFPAAKRYYKLFIYFIGYVAINGRSTLYGSLSTKDGTTPSKAANGGAK